MRRRRMEPPSSHASGRPESTLHIEEPAASGLSTAQPEPKRPDKLGRDFEILWRSYAVSQFGIAFSAGAIAVVAIDELGASALAVAVAFGVARLFAAVCSVPVGVFVEKRRKRPTLIATDLSRSVATLAVPILLWNNQLTMVTLAVTIAADVFMSIAATSASSAHLKDLLPQRDWSRGFARIETTNWVFLAVFTPLGGLTVTLLGPTITLTIDAATYVVSALVLRLIRKPERVPKAIRFRGVRPFLHEATGGWRYIWNTPALRALFQNALLFGGSLVLIQPLLAVLVLRELDLDPWQYTVILGIPGVGGVVGATLAPRIEQAISTRRMLLYFGTGRTVWTIWIVLSPPGPAGFAVVLVAEVLLMFSAGAFNPIFAAYQASITNNDYMARVSAAWGASSMIVQPSFMILGGLATGVVGLRPTIAIGAILLASSSLLLPWRQLPDDLPTIEERRNAS